jgi:NADH:ubiquinone oxidoreductase subunit 6 (subunit J)
MELTLFVIVGAIAVISAAMMLISENAIYSALFLILNFACIAFFFLMLNAPFLAMVQITVYAGAIMVLFLFVIMLLGAERVLPEDPPRFRWLAPAVIVLALAFFIVASVAIIGGKIDLVAPDKSQPYVRVVHALDGVAAVDLYLDGQPVAQGLDYGQSTDFKTWKEGRYEADLFAAGADPTTDKPLASQRLDVTAGNALSLVAVGRTGSPSGAALVVATEDLNYSDKKDSVRVTAVNALPDRPSVDVLDDTEDTRTVLVGALPYGTASKMFEVNKGTYTIGLYAAGNDRNRLAALKDKKFDANTSVLWVFTEERQADNSFTDVVINLEATTYPLFGSPTLVGRLLFTQYVLPFEMVALLLLVAMIGAIVLTHETLAPRRQMVRRLANPPAGLEQPIIGESGK